MTGPSAATVAKGLWDHCLDGPHNDNCRFVAERYTKGSSTFQMTYEGPMDEVVYTITVTKKVEE